MNLYLIVAAEDDIEIPDFRDEILYLHFKSTVLKSLENPTVIYFGYAPDNTADGMDELLYDGNQFRIIAPKKYLGIKLKSDIKKIIESFKKIVENERPFWSSVIIENGLIRTETTIEFLYR